MDDGLPRPGGPVDPRAPLTPAAMTEDEIYRLERPHPSLWKLYLIRSVLSGPAIFIALPILFFRYHTLRYRFDREGIHARWGILFRREINLAYARIQDIHLTSGFIQRWLGLADVQVQTASGSATPELVIEGFREFAAIRDFLYTRMRGYQSPGRGTHPAGRPGVVAGGAAAGDGLDALRELRDEIRATRIALERLAPPGADPASDSHV